MFSILGRTIHFCKKSLGAYFHDISDDYNVAYKNSHLRLHMYIFIKVIGYDIGHTVKVPLSKQRTTKVLLFTFIVSMYKTNFLTFVISHLLNIY